MFILSYHNCDKATAISSLPNSMLIIQNLTLHRKQAALKYAITAITTPEKAGVNPTVKLFENKLTQ